MKLSLERKGLVRIGIIGSILLVLVLIGFFVVNFIMPTSATITGQGTLGSGTQGPVWANLTRGDMFFAHGNTVFILANFSCTPTGPNASVCNRTMLTTANFTAIGGNASNKGVFIRDNGTSLTSSWALFEFNDTVNGSGTLSNITNIEPKTIIVNATAGGDSATIGNLTYSDLNGTVLLVNMSVPPGCPPSGTPLPPQIPLLNGTMVNIANCSTTCTVNDRAQVINSTYYQLCGMTFGGRTTNFTDVANNGNFSNFNFTIDIPGKATIAFETNVSMDTQQKAQALFEFAMKNVMTGGKIGVNDSEWGGTDATKPNLNLSARLTLNVTGLPITGVPQIVRSAFGTEAASGTSCPANVCTNLAWNGENITFTVTGFSDYGLQDGINVSLNTANFSFVSGVGPARNINFTFTPTWNGTMDMKNCTLYGNFSAPALPWTANATNTTKLVNGTVNGINKTVSSDASYLWNVYCFDVTGSYDYEGTNFSVTVDTAAPVVYAITPANNTYINGTSTQLFQANVSDTNLNATFNSNATVTYRQLGASSWSTAVTRCYSIGSIYVCNATINLSINEFDTGENPFNLEYFFNITDKAGTWGSNGTFSNPLNATVDRAAPKWSNNQTNIPAKYTTTTTQFNITWTDTANAFNTSVIEINHTGTLTNYTMAHFGGGVYNYNATLPAGGIAWRFYGNDTLGNLNRTDFINVTISAAATTLSLFLNGTAANRSYQVSQLANFTAVVNITGVRVNLTTSIVGWPTNSTDNRTENITSLPINATLYNITGWIEANTNYSASSQTYWATVWGWSNTSITLNTTWVKLNGTSTGGQAINVTCMVNNTNSSSTVLSDYYVEIYNGTRNLTAGVTGSTAKFVYIFTPSASIEGTQTLKCALYDNTSRYYNATVNGTATFTSDFTTPVLLNPTPTNNTVIAGSSSQLFQINVTELNLNYTSNGTVYYKRDIASSWSSASLIRYGSGSYHTLNNSVDLSIYPNGAIIQYFFNVSDNAANVGYNGTQSNPLNATIDRSGPTVSDVQINDTIVKNNDVIMVNATVTDVSISSVVLRINNTQYTMSNIGSNKYQYNFTASTGLTSGINYTVNVTGIDTGGNAGSNTSLNITFDANAPSNITFIRPLAAQNVTGALTINVSVHDNRNVTVDTVLYNVSNATYSFTNTSTAMSRYWGDVAQGNYTSALDTTTLMDGSYNISVIANDTAGNVNNTRLDVTVNITIDNKNPIVSITTPIARQNITGPVNVNVSVTDGSGSGAQTVRVNISNSSWSNASWDAGTLWPAVAQSGNYWNFSLNASNGTKGLRDGSYNITINVTDYAGRTNTTEIVNITIDNTRPSLFLVNGSVETFINITNKTGNVIFINASVSDGSGSGAITPCNVTFVNSSHTVPVTTNLTLANNWCGGTVTIPTSLYTGNYSLYVNVSDFSGLNGFNGTYGVSVDNLAPAVTSLATNSTINGNNTANATAVLNITVTVTEAGAWYRATYVSVVLVNNTAMVSVGGNVYSITNTTTQLGCSSTGPCVLAITANDTLNNVNSTTTLVVTVDATPPTISINSPASDQNISGSFVINATVNDNINVSSVQYQINNNSWADSWFQLPNGTNPNATGGANYNTTNRTNNAGIDDGVYNITFWANDTVNNTYQTNRTVRFDNRAPTVLVYNYTNGTALVAGTYYYFNIRVNDSGSGVNNSIALNVTIGNNFTTQVSLTAMDSATLGWYNGSVQVPTSLESGNKTIILNITDRAGNLGTNNSFVVNVTADVTGPTVIVYNLTGNGVFSNGTWKRAGNNFTINASLSDSGSGLSGNCNVTLVNSTDTFFATPLLARTGSAGSGWCGGTVTIPTTVTRNMNYTIHVNVSDVGGNVGLNNSFMIAIDNIGPNLTLHNATNPLVNGTFLRSGQAFVLNISVTDAPGVGVNTGELCNIALNRTLLGTISYSSGWCNGSVSVSGSNGLYTLNITLNDTLNNTGSNTTFEVVVDSTMPTITVDSPANGSYKNVSTDRRIWINGTVYDNGKMGANNVTVNDSTRFGVITFTAGNNTAFNISNTSAIADGYVALIINYTDTAGNNGNATVYFYEDNTAPSVVVGITNSTNNGAYRPNSSEQVRVIVTDAQQANATIFLNYMIVGNNTWITVPMTGTPGTTTVYTATVDTSVLSSDGQWIKYYINGVDNATNSIPPSVGGNQSSPLGNLTIDNYCGNSGVALKYCSDDALNTLALNQYAEVHWLKEQLEAASSLSSNYNISNVLSSISGKFSYVYHYNRTSGQWVAYDPNILWSLNTLRFGNNTNSTEYWINVTSSGAIIRIV